MASRSSSTAAHSRRRLLADSGAHADRPGRMAAHGDRRRRSSKRATARSITTPRSPSSPSPAPSSTRRVTDCRKLFPPLTAITARDVSYDPSQCSNLKGTSTVQQALDVLCQGTGGENEDGIHVKGIFLPSGAALLNDNLIAPADLVKGIRIDCDEAAVRRQRGQQERPAQSGLHADRGSAVAAARRRASVLGPRCRRPSSAFTPVTLAADVIVARERDYVDAAAADAEVVERSAAADVHGDDEPAEPARAGAAEAERAISSGDRSARRSSISMAKCSACRRMAASTSRLPSGNGRRGGDFDMWFWLLRQGVRIPGIGFFPGRASRFFAVSGRDVVRQGSGAARNRAIITRFEGRAAGRLRSRRRVSGSMPSKLQVSPGARVCPVWSDSPATVRPTRHVPERATAGCDAHCDEIRGRAGCAAARTRACGYGHRRAAGLRDWRRGAWAVVAAARLRH